MASGDEEVNVELGFAEKTDSWRLRSKFFPSKLGGKPAWLALKKLPSSLKCACGEPLTFILQVGTGVGGIVLSVFYEDGAPFHEKIFIQQI